MVPRPRFPVESTVAVRHLASDRVLGLSTAARAIWDADDDRASRGEDPAIERHDAILSDLFGAAAGLGDPPQPPAIACRSVLDVGALLGTLDLRPTEFGHAASLASHTSHFPHPSGTHRSCR